MVKYRTIVESIRGDILKGRYSVGAKLPSQKELAAQFDTSRMTIQKALNTLRQEDVIYSIKGSGCFVKSNLLGLTDVSEYIGLTRRFQNHGHITSRAISFQIRSAVEEEIERLDLRPGDTVYDIIRLRHVNGEPYSLEYSIFPTRLIPGLTEEILKNSIYAHIQGTLKLSIGTATRRIRADKADYYDQKYLGCDKHDPVLEVSQVICLTDGRPFEFSQVRYPYSVGEFTYIGI